MLNTMNAIVKKKKSIFITGIFRSGTTLLTRILNTHPKIAVNYQLLFPFFKMWHTLFFERVVSGSFSFSNLMGTNAILDTNLLEILGKSGTKVHFSDTNVKKLQSLCMKELQNDNHEKPFIPQGTFAGLTAGTAEEVFIQLFNRLKNICARDVEYVGFKEIWCEEFAPALLNMKKIDFKCVQVLRDPRGVFASRNTGRHLKMCGGKKYPLLFIVESWRRSFIIAEKLFGHHAFYFLNYENLIKKSRVEICKICKFLGINFTDEMSNPEKFTDGKGNPWKANTTGVNNSPAFNKEPLAYWQSALSEEEIGSIEFLCAREMKFLGYRKKFSNDKAQKMFIRYHENEKQIQPWLVPFGYTCNGRTKNAKIRQMEKIHEN